MKYHTGLDNDHVVCHTICYSSTHFHVTDFDVASTSYQCKFMAVFVKEVKTYSLNSFRLKQK